MNFGMIMYPNHFQNSDKILTALSIFLILTHVLLNEM